ncbi:MAG: L-lactate dehydrogenase [Candidatus Nanoperiomorbaceae bacterium]
MSKTAIKLSVVGGAGLVGATTAYTAVMKGLASEVVLCDVLADKAEGEAMDISHGLAFEPQGKVYSGDYPATKDSDLVIITAGTGQHPGETRLAMVSRNAKIMTDVAQNVAQYSPNAVYLIISNPVDIMTQVFQEVSGIPTERVIGSGTNLDTARFRYILSQKFGVDVKNVHAYILGEHGDSEFPAWSIMDIAQMRINEASDVFGGVMQDADYDQIANEVKNAAYEIINRKGATYYGIAMSATRIAEAILRDEKAIFPLSVKLTGQYGIDGVNLSLPAVVGQNGIEKILAPHLSDPEVASLHHSADILRAAKAEIAK